MNPNVLASKTHRLHVERIRGRIEAVMHRESERDVDVARDRLDLRIRAAVMTVLDEELYAAKDAERVAEQIAALEKTFTGAKS